jgi:low temperature requirement protein LtrA
LVLLYARAYRHVPDARATIVIYLAGTTAGATLWALSLPVHGTGRYLLWTAGILVEAAAPLVATRFGGNFSLFVILVLGESVASIVTGVHDQQWTMSSVLAAALGFVAVAALWWIYFDLGGAAGKRKLVEDGDDQESGVADAYVYGHLPVILGLSVAAVGIEQYIVHADDSLSTTGRWALSAGVTLYLTGVAVVMMGTSGRWRTAWPWPLAVVPPIGLLGLVDALTPPLLAGVVAAVLMATVLVGIRKQRHGDLQTTET